MQRQTVSDLHRYAPRLYSLFVPFPVPPIWERDTDESQRDEVKRLYSPCSFFYSQGQALITAARYFSDERLADNASSEVAKKHRHRIQLALFGQMMASYEYMLKDFLARIIDIVDVFDQKLVKQKWISVDTERILSQRVAQTTVGSLLIHPTLGWHDPDQVNERCQSVLGNKVILPSEIPTLNRLWILRHSVAHNAGFVTGPDAGRIGSAEVFEKVIDTDDDYMWQVFEFLKPIAARLTDTCGRSVLQQWLNSTKDLDANYDRDRLIYERLKSIGTYLPSRPKGLPDFTEKDYLNDRATVNAAN